jgi:CRP-like cAMP-binding protein
MKSKDRRSGFQRRIARSDRISSERRNEPERRTLLRDPDITIGRLRLIPLFANLTMPQYASILNICFKQRLHRGDMLCRVDDPADTLFFLISGMIRVSAPDGGEFMRSSVKDVIGRIGFFTNTRHTMTVTADSQCDILAIGRVELMRLL